MFTISSRLASCGTRACWTRVGYRSASSLVVSEPIPSDGSIPPATLSAITAAAKFNGPISLLTVTDDSEKKLLNIPKEVANIIIARSPPSQSLLAEIISDAVVRAAGDSDFSHIVACASKYGGNFLPRAAAILDVSPVTDVIEIVDENTYVRPMYAGNAIAKVKNQSGKPLQIISVRQTAFEKANTDDDAYQPETTVIELDGAENVKWLKENVSKSDRPDLGSASVVVSGGRGMGNGENFAILENLADKLGGAVGASRAAVDAGFVSNDKQVGQTGKVVAPDLYIAVGISGAIQHLSGMKDSKTIVAINKDAEAPIFQVADYGLVDDLFDAVPELTEKL
eukprot:CAMPEP_0194357114 /NCGR_PEP_ID=MMETSP0174-20130528/4644_1 /TAXON_ID=216777 /ORGANISM="Proboscia alata, Strain PI-D3" /LENGTH=338 /DNA_ID=CAMNT_0039127001 /DNA_START=10 /DNA_END=1026 /DNA_ORIENTATION=-